jgi:hypothetical protein
VNAFRKCRSETRPLQRIELERFTGTLLEALL